MEDKERISVSIFPSQLEKLNKEQDIREISTRSKMVRLILDDYFKLTQPEEGAEYFFVKIPAGLLEEMRYLLNRKNSEGERSPLFVDETEMILYGLRKLLKDYLYYLEGEHGRR